MFCTKCGNALPVNAKFCTKCGTKVEAFLLFYVSFVSNFQIIFIIDSIVQKCGTPIPYPALSFLSFKFLPVLFWNELRIIRQLIPRYKPEVPAMKFLPVRLPAGYQSGNSPVSRLLQLSMHTEAGLLHG